MLVSSNVYICILQVEIALYVNQLILYPPGWTAEATLSGPAGGKRSEIPISFNEKRSPVNARVHNHCTPLDNTNLKAARRQHVISYLVYCLVLNECSNRRLALALQASCFTKKKSPRTLTPEIRTFVSWKKNSGSSAQTGHRIKYQINQMVNGTQK
jgi:hypothetical protein